MSHITDHMASWETPASEHTGGTMREGQGEGDKGRDLDWGGSVWGVFKGCGETCNLRCFNRTGEAWLRNVFKRVSLFFAGGIVSSRFYRWSV